jgi:hypothetical protein
MTSFNIRWFFDQPGEILKIMVGKANLFAKVAADQQGITPKSSPVS